MNLFVYGSRSFARTLADLAVDCGHVPVGFIDDFNTGPGIVGTLEQALVRHAGDAQGIVLGIGYSNLPARRAAWQRLKASGMALPSLVHPQAYVARTAKVAAGCLIMTRAVIDRNACLGEAVVIWPAAIVNHDTTVGANTFLSPGATLCGDVEVGEDCFIGASAVVANGGHIEGGRFLRMNGAYAGRPARRVA